MTTDDTMRLWFKDGWRDNHEHIPDKWNFRHTSTFTMYFQRRRTPGTIALLREEDHLVGEGHRRAAKPGYQKIIRLGCTSTAEL